MDERETLRQIEAALGANNLSRAADLAEVAVEAGLRLPLTLNLLAWRREEAGDFAGAQQLLDEALRLAPNDPFLHIALGAVLRKQGQITAAIKLLSATEALAGQNPALWLERGYAYEAGGDLERAAADFHRAIRLDPRSAPPQTALATVTARQGNATEARAHAEHALMLEPGNAIARLALARCDILEGQLQRAEHALQTLVTADVLPLADRVIALGLLGDVHDRQGATAAAFAAYEAANNAYIDLHGSRVAMEQRESHTAWVQRVGRIFTDMDKANWAHSGSGQDTSPAKVHAFLCGYPRSGTTLVETILASAEGVETIEERPTLQTAERAYLEEPEALRRWGALPSSALDVYRRAYWQSVQSFGCDVQGNLFVDMDPLKGIKLPLIARLFPQARIIIMRRDPRDVVWSCFRTNFALTAAAWEFTSLEATANHYVGVMHLMEQCLATLPLTVHELRYDSLVHDFDSTTQALCAFLGLSWSPRLREFQQTATQRTVSTASALQVRQPLFDGTRQWERYAAYMAPILPLLQPWVTKFGF